MHLESPSILGSSLILFRLSFSITVVPCSAICLVTLLVAQALKDDAFEAGFESLEEIMTRPDTAALDTLPLHWKSGMADKHIVPLKYPVFSQIWHHSLHVAGLRDDNQRPYSLRVGDGGRLDGELIDLFGPILQRTY